MAAALIHKESAECSSSPFELFGLPPTNTAVLKTMEVEHQPRSALQDGSAVEIKVPALTEEYWDLHNSRLYMRVKVVRNNGNKLQAADIVAPINDIFNSFWKNVELKVGREETSHSNNLHAYRSFIYHLLHDSDESLTSEREMRLLYKDTAGQLDAVNASVANPNHLIAGVDWVANNDNTARVRSAADAALGNDGLYRRFCATQLSREVELLGGLSIDLFEQERYLLPGVSMLLRFTRQTQAFMLMALDDDYRIELLDMKLYMRKVTPAPGVVLGHKDALASTTAKYPVTSKKVTSVALPAGILDKKTETIFEGQLPKRVVIGLVTAAAMGGAFNQNPFNFQQFSVTHMQLEVNGEPVRAQALKPLVEEEHRYIHSFETLFRGVNKLDGERGSIIKRADWPRGYALYVFDLTPDMDADDHYTLLKTGTVRLDLQFGAALGEAVNVIVYAEFDQLIEITAEHNVSRAYV